MKKGDLRKVAFFMPASNISVATFVGAGLPAKNSQPPHTS
jgi:hypothetical protein